MTVDLERSQTSDTDGEQRVTPEGLRAYNAAKKHAQELGLSLDRSDNPMDLGHAVYAERSNGSIESVKYTGYVDEKGRKMFLTSEGDFKPVSAPVLTAEVQASLKAKLDELTWGPKPEKTPEVGAADIDATPKEEVVEDLGEEAVEASGVEVPDKPKETLFDKLSPEDQADVLQYRNLVREQSHAHNQGEYLQSKDLKEAAFTLKQRMSQSAVDAIWE